MYMICVCDSAVCDSMCVTLCVCVSVCLCVCLCLCGGWVGGASMCLRACVLVWLKTDARNERGETNA